MSFDKWMGQIFLEAELYETVLFQVEENFEQYLGQCLHLYFDRVDSGKVRVTAMRSFASDAEADRHSRQIIEKQEWLEVLGGVDQIHLFLCRFDRTGFLSSISKDSTHTQDWCMGWIDETVPRKPLTQEEIRQAFQELTGCLEGHLVHQESKLKKAV